MQIVSRGCEMKSGSFILLSFILLNLHESFSLDNPVSPTLIKRCLKMQVSNIYNQLEMFYNCIHRDFWGLSTLALIDCDCPLTSF